MDRRGKRATKQVLTDRVVRSLKPRHKGQWVAWDATLPNFGVRVSAQGKRVFVVVRRQAGRLVWLSFGEYPATSLAKARGAARKALQAMSVGQVPTVPRQRRLEPLQDTFATMADDYVRLYLSTLRAGEVAERMIVKTLVPAWGSRRVEDVKRSDVTALAEAVKVSRGISAGKHVIAVTSAFYSWLINRGDVEVNPAFGVKKSRLLGRQVPRSRVLSDDEVRKVWLATLDEKYPWRQLVQLLFLTACRGGEVKGLRWSEIEGDTVTIPAERMKAGVAHSVPLVATAMEVLATCYRFVGRDFVLSTTGGRVPIDNPDRVKVRLDRRSGVTGWWWHDIRRTVRSALPGLGVINEHAEMVLAHAQDAMVATYNLHGYDAEKRRALERWEAQLLKLVG
jgi:integrase